MYGVAFADGGPYKIEFKPGEGGTGSMDDINNINYGDSVTLPLNEFTNEGNYFWGWCFITDGYADCQDGETLTFTDEFEASGGYHPLAPNFMHDNTLTLTAYWRETEAPPSPYVNPTPDPVADPAEPASEAEPVADPAEPASEAEPAADPAEPASEAEPAADSDAPAPVILTPEQIREMSIHSFVENLYIVILNRHYEDIGRTNWMDDLANGAGGTEIVRGFFGSQEFLAMNLSNEDYVRTLYRTFCNNMSPDAEGLADWTAALDNGTLTRDQLVDQFAATPEWASICAFYQVNV